MTASANIGDNFFIIRQFKAVYRKWHNRQSIAEADTPYCLAIAIMIEYVSFLAYKSH